AGLARGSPGSDFPQVGGLRFRGVVGVGYLWPEARPTLRMESGIAHRVLGNDEAFLGAYYRTEAGNQAQRAWGVTLHYRWYASG
ncbi:MAG TPA: hypothetical protein VKA48_06505, partial [Gammaproteobacteria bacterium]|nr:hypothetical protein [Gammaproteobacteria bacterium]